MTPAALLERPILLTERAELARLDTHFVRVLRRLHTRPPARLSPAQRRARATHLDRLQAYARRRVFPKNVRFLGRMLPHFIDEFGTRCAMGHLIEASGARDVVQYIARERNFDRIRELRNIPALVAWLEANGLTAEEAAQIQPSYCGTPAHNCVCGDAFANGMVEGTLGSGGTTLIVTAVYGPATGVKVGDEVPLYLNSEVPPAAGDILFANWNSNGQAYLEYVASGGTINVPTSACWFPQEANIPGPLPIGTVQQALASTDITGCEQVLAQYDPKWGEMQGGPECTGSGGTGGTSGSGGGGNAGTAGTISNTGGSGANVSDAGPRDGGTQAAADSGGGCGIAHSSGFGAEALLAVSAALVLYRTRRR